MFLLAPGGHFVASRLHLMSNYARCYFCGCVIKLYARCAAKAVDKASS